MLNTYEQERIPVAKRLLATTDRVFQVIVMDGWFGRLFRTRILARVVAFAMTKEWVRKLAFQTISQIGIRYRESSLSKNLPGLPDGAPRAGDRFPWMKLAFQPDGRVEDLFARLEDTCFNLLVFGQAAPALPEMGDLVHAHAVPASPANESEQARVGITGPAFYYLLRPDGYVGLAGTTADAVAIKSYLAAIGCGASLI